ncbi:hypothetical protein [Lysobacter solisilvae (ex Woo and Kim 2020)]|uniref:Uncharacterized protein n=1 Tax=Agrilutibacter terrestris TaxID=2865112 RepID=A0A7H0FUF6_9GAMM|nr:hypothetical protein [Lysobacter terrestris]QNP39672.1 hypothetical protein H8B22_09075 [Lysobacter terrestris]
MSTITVGINAETRPLAAADPQWIIQQIDGRRRDGLVVCVRVSISTPDLHMTLATPTCGSGAGGRPPTPHERAVFELWRKRGLDEHDYQAAHVVAFLKQLPHYL